MSSGRGFTDQALAFSSPFMTRQGVPTGSFFARSGGALVRPTVASGRWYLDVLREIGHTWNGRPERGGGAGIGEPLSMAFAAISVGLCGCQKGLFSTVGLIRSSPTPRERSVLAKVWSTPGECVPLARGTCVYRKP